MAGTSAAPAATAREAKPRRRGTVSKNGRRPAPPPDPELIVDPAESAKAAGLRYVSDRRPGIGRKRAGRGWSYLGLDGTPIRDRKELERFAALAIPPAYTEVWISPHPNGHIQATGRDARGRKQYRYHPRWREVRDETKYGRMVAFAQALPALRARVEKDLASPGLTRPKVLATVVRLLEVSLIRVGNQEYARTNESFGLTTMRDEHVDVAGATLRFVFRGKGGKEHRVHVHDQRLSRIVQRSQDLPGEELFQYVDDDGERQTIDSGDVNDYLREITGQEFTAKDFRTWAGTVLAARALREFEAFDSEAQAKRNIVEAIEAVAERLGNTRAVCRESYIHPALLDAYLDGSLIHTLRQRAEAELAEGLHDLEPEEAAVLAVLQQRLAREERDAEQADRRTGGRAS